MAKIILVGQDDLQVNKERAEEIKEKWNEDKFKKDDKIKVGENSIKADDIRSIRISKKEKDEEENVTSLPTEEIKKRLGNFEEKYEEHKSGELESYNGIGVMDTGIMGWLLGEAIVEEGGRYKVRPERWEAFSKSKAMLEELNYRREVAEEKDEEYLEQVVKQGKLST